MVFFILEDVISENAVGLFTPGPGLKNVIKITIDAWPTDEQVSNHFLISYDGA